MEQENMDITSDMSQDLISDMSQDLTNNTNTSLDTTNDEILKTTNILTKTDIERLIAQKSSRVSFTEKDPKLKSNIWNRFNRILVDNKLQDFVVCKNCPTLYAWKSRTGTHSLSKHICQSMTTNKKRGAAKPISESGKSFETGTVHNFLVKTVPQLAKHNLNKSITFGLAKDLRSFRTVEGIGFKHLAQSLINFGAKYGCQRVEDVIQHRTTLRNKYVPELTNDGRSSAKRMFESLSVPAIHQFAFSTDLWSEKYQKRNFLSLSIHFIDNEWNLHADMLGLEEILERKTTDNITKECVEILKLFFNESQVNEMIETSFAVTDGGPNMLNVFLQQLPCQCHKLNLLVDWTLNDRKLPTEAKILQRAQKGRPYNPRKLFNFKTCCPLLYESFAGVKGVVTYFKQSCLNSKLPTTLKQDVPTRWDSELQMLESYVKVKNDIELLLLEKRELDKIMNINHDLLNELIELLKPIRKCSQTLSGHKYPTIQLVAMSHSELKEAIDKFEAKSEEMTSLLEQAKICFKDFVVTMDIHYLACMLDPRYRQLKFAEPNVRREAVSYLKFMVDRYAAHGDKTQQCDSTSTPVSTSAASTKNKSTRFEKFQDDEEDVAEPEISEVDRYLTHRFDLSKYMDKSGNFDILYFWKDTNIFPNVKAVARSILAIPAAETTDERNFSSAGQALTPRRTLLSGESLSELLFIHKSVDAPKC